MLSDLVRLSFRTAAAVAAFLQDCESVLWGGDSPWARQLVDGEPAEGLLRAIRTRGRTSEWDRSELRSDFRGDPPEWGQLEERLARLVAEYWRHPSRRGRPSRRPDVLALTARLLANPEAPQSYEIGRFAIVLALRTLYGVSFDRNRLERLRSTYDDLRRRFLFQRRRQRSQADEVESLLIDVLVLDGHIERSLSSSNLEAYYQGFRHYPLGVTAESRRIFAPLAEQDWPQLTGQLPDFPTVVNQLFSQPLAVPGLDEVTGGLLGSVLPTGSLQSDSGGLVTLIAGPPGSGKTTFCLSLAAYFRELGSAVSYVSTEETAGALRAKALSIPYPSLVSFWPLFIDASKNVAEFRVLAGEDLNGLEELVSDTEAELELARADSRHSAGKNPEYFLVFPRVLFVDSINPLLQEGPNDNAAPPVEGRLRGQSSSASDNRGRRAWLRDLLARLRKAGVCVVLVGGPDDAEDGGLEFLVDNILTLGFDTQLSHRHPVRTLTIGKTRLQASHRGSHVFHISRIDGCGVSPGLHSVLRVLKGREWLSSDESHRAVLWTPAVGVGPQRPIPGLAVYDPVTVRARSQILVYGHDSASKAAFAIGLALEPRVLSSDDGRWNDYLERRSLQKPPRVGWEDAHLADTRVLVVSFLFGEDYYHRLAAGCVHRRFQRKLPDATRLATRLVTVLSFYPGYIDPETVVNRVRLELKGSAIEGRRYTSVVLDGVHNIMSQFPLLQQEPLLWPTLYRALRAEGVDGISTFTVFRSPAPFVSDDVDYDGPINVASPQTRLRPKRVPDEAVWLRGERLLYHLLASSCDYIFQIERSGHSGMGERQRLAQVRLLSSIDGMAAHPRAFLWDADNFSSVPRLRKGTSE